MIQLPIDSHLEKIAQCFRNKSNLVLTASPGSGKTTRIPWYLQCHLKLNNKITVVLVPKRLAATSACYRVAEENNLVVGGKVGYQVRFENRMSAQTELLFMTEGLFLKRASDDSFWQQIGLIVFDEFHERSSAIDIALGLAVEKQILGCDLKILVMSATLNASKIQNFLTDASLYQVDERPFNLTVVKSSKPQNLVCDEKLALQITEALEDGWKKTEGDVLIFLPGLSEMRFIERHIARKFSNVKICLLHGSMKLDEQREILKAKATGESRKIVLSTNVAESSITLPSVDLVIDSGLAKKSIKEIKIGFRRLEITRISLFSAHQRAGRAARTKNGWCYQLWHEVDERSMSEQIVPEILASDLLWESLALSSCGISRGEQFSWLDRPKNSFELAREKLLNWELLNSESDLTEKGKFVQSCPLDLEFGLLFYELVTSGHREIAARLLAYIESANFDLVTEYPEIEKLSLSENSKRVEFQLLNLASKISLNNLKKSSQSFLSDLIGVHFKYFSNRVAKLKSGSSAVSSLGRGVELAPYLASKRFDYFLLLSGRELSDSKTYCDMAIGFYQKDFDVIANAKAQIQSTFDYDIESKRFFKRESKSVGSFIISEGNKNYVSESDYPIESKKVFIKNFSELWKSHPDYESLLSRLNFILKKRDLMGLDVDSIHYIENAESQLLSLYADQSSPFTSFFSSSLEVMFCAVAPNPVVTCLKKLPLSIKLPNERSVSIDYNSEHAPKVSARVQDFYGLKENPKLVDGKIRVTLEMLAPNQRPAQVTSQLESFWKAGYFELRKELRARYPKHSWPDDPSLTTSIVVRKK